MEAQQQEISIRKHRKTIAVSTTELFFKVRRNQSLNLWCYFCNLKAVGDDCGRQVCMSMKFEFELRLKRDGFHCRDS
jgi:hypothetical protein